MRAPNLIPKIPKLSRAPLLTAMLLLFAFNLPVHAQGLFKNLGFESANVTGAAPANQIPTANGFPNWTVTETPASMQPVVLSQVWYDTLALSSAIVAINDSSLGASLGFSIPPINGNFSAYLAGGEGNAITIQQTGLVPVGTKSLLVDVQTTEFNLQTTLGGQTINMVPLSSTSAYTVYGGDISAFAGLTEQLAFTEPNTTGLGQATIDGIAFSPNPIPEPAAGSLLLCGAGLLGAIRYARSKSNS